jgi:adenylate cyclase
MALTAVERRSATLVSADAAGYSRLMAADEVATINAINVFREAGEQIASEHSGRLVDSPGDNLLFEFDDASRALEAALRFQAFALETSENRAPDERMQFRIGMHSGEVVVDRSRIYGSGINIAARLERLARPGGICISEEIRDQLDVAPPLEDIGAQYVKNIPHPVHAFFVEVPGQTVPASPATSPWPAIAVLPFETPEGDRDAEYLGDGMSEDLITTLAMWHQFPVIARNSTFTYKGQTVDPVVVGRELGAEYLVTGSLRRLDRRVRISVQLVDADSGEPLWADRWNTTLEDAFDTGGEIAQAISVALRPELLKDMSERAMRQTPADMTAWDYALRGLWHLRRTTPGDGERAIELLGRAVQLDPTSGFLTGILRMRTTGCCRTIGRWIAIRISPPCSTTRSWRSRVTRGTRTATCSAPSLARFRASATKRLSTSGAPSSSIQACPWRVRSSASSWAWQAERRKGSASWTTQFVSVRATRSCGASMPAKSSSCSSRAAMRRRAQRASACSRSTRTRP